MSGFSVQNVDEKVAKDFFKNMRSDVSNRVCFDCPRKGATWCSIPFGIMICSECSGHHRRLGTHITFVRSSTLDSWTEAQLLILGSGGNKNAHDYFRKKGWRDGGRLDRNAKFTSKIALLYKEHLIRQVQLNRKELLTKLYANSPGGRPNVSKGAKEVDTLDLIANELGTSVTQSNTEVKRQHILTPAPAPVAQPLEPEPERIIVRSSNSSRKTSRNLLNLNVRSSIRASAIQSFDDFDFDSFTTKPVAKTQISPKASGKTNNSSSTSPRQNTNNPNGPTTTSSSSLILPDVEVSLKRSSSSSNNTQISRPNQPRAQVAPVKIPEKKRSTAIKNTKISAATRATTQGSGLDDLDFFGSLGL